MGDVPKEAVDPGRRGKRAAAKVLVEIGGIGGEGLGRSGRGKQFLALSRTQLEKRDSDARLRAAAV